MKNTGKAVLSTFDGHAPPQIYNSAGIIVNSTKEVVVKENRSKIINCFCMKGQLLLHNHMNL